MLKILLLLPLLQQNLATRGRGICQRNITKYLVLLYIEPVYIEVKSLLIPTYEQPT